MTELSPSFLVVTVNVNDNQKTEIGRIEGNTGFNCLLSTSDSLETQRHKQIKNKRMEKGVPCK